MEALKDWAVSICFAALAAGIVNMLFPNGSMERIFKVMVSAFLICCLVSPFLSGRDFKIELSEVSADVMSGNYEDLEKKIRDQSLKTAEENVKRLLEEELKKREIVYREIRVDMDIAEDNRILIKEVVLVLPDREMNKSVSLKSDLYAQFGLEVQIRSDGDS